MTRFFVNPDQIENGYATLDAGDAAHLMRVLRAGPGDPVDVLDGSGTIYHCMLDTLLKSSAVARIESSETLHTEPRVRIAVAQALPKTSEKLEWVLQHGVELGVAEFWMVRSRRSEAGKLAEREDRWSRIVKTAAEQSGRAILPKALQLGTLQAIVKRSGEFDLALLCDESRGAVPLRRAVGKSAAKSVLILVGPEGGWDDDEREQAAQAGMLAVSLGPRILRTETAALVAASQVLYALDAG